MEFPKEQTDELKRYCAKLRQLNEGGVTYFHMEGLRLPDGCDPQVCSALLCPMTGEPTYPSRLYFETQVASPYPRNWHVNVRIGEKNWVAFSWTTPAGLSLVQMLNAHMSGFTRPS